MSAEELQSTADTGDRKHAKLFQSVNNLTNRILTLAEGKFTGTVFYELDMMEGGFKFDNFGSKGRMTPK